MGRMKCDNYGTSSSTTGGLQILCNELTALARKMADRERYESGPKEKKKIEENK